MVKMPDGAKFEMQWKQVKYTKNERNIVFEIVPMYQREDIVVFPNSNLWDETQNVFSDHERQEIIFLLERIAWKRDIRLVETNIKPNLVSNNEPIKGSIESTSGYQEISSQNLFDPQSPLNKTQVKNIYCILEKRFAENVSGIATIPKNVIIPGSVLAEISIPILTKNTNVQLNII